MSGLLMANLGAVRHVARLVLSRQTETIKTIQTKQRVLDIKFLTRGSHRAHIDDAAPK